MDACIIKDSSIAVCIIFFTENVSFICDPTVTVMFTCSDPPLVMTYDSIVGVHSVWEITKAKPEVCVLVKLGGFI